MNRLCARSILCSARPLQLSRTSCGLSLRLRAHLFSTSRTLFNPSDAGTNTNPTTTTTQTQTHTPPPPTHTNSRHAPDASPTDPYIIYQGPLALTYRRLKLFSLSSLALSFTISPFFFLVESSLPFSVRLILVGITLGASSIPTALVAWVGKSYVTAIHRMPPPPPSPSAGSEVVKEAEAEAAAGGSLLELTTLNMFLQPRITRIYDPAFIADTDRPFAKWELADMVQLPQDEMVQLPQEEMQKAVPEPGSEETVAETMDREGRVLGRWIVRWEEGGEGNCRGEGKILQCVLSFFLFLSFLKERDARMLIGRCDRYFNLHEELISTWVR